MFYNCCSFGKKKIEMVFSNNPVKETVLALESLKNIQAGILQQQSSLRVFSKSLFSMNHAVHLNNHDWCFVLEILTVLQSQNSLVSVSRRKHHHSATSRLSWREPTFVPCAPLFPGCLTLPLLYADVSSNSVSKFYFINFCILLI